MGYGWELQAGALLVVENGEFRFRDKIKLTDEGGSVTDTYTFDAFGNLTSSTGDTENSYLYRGEQFDSFTGLYYLRARYMNPSTGTFITMDEYAGSVFEPLSLHKYLYANANPVMNSDPTGYFSLSELNVTQTIEATLHKMLTPNFSNVMKWINFFASFFDTCNQIQQMLSDGATLGDIASSMLRGAVSGLLLNKMCMIKGIGPILSKIMIGYGYYVQIQAFDEAIKDGDIVSAILIGLQVGTDLTALGDSCFTGDTFVAAENGQKRIDEIEIGDKVWAYNVETGETELKTVTKVYVHSVDEILHLYTDEGNIDTTTNHPFYVIDKGWVAAGDLAIGDEVYNLDGTTSTILGSEIEVLAEPVIVYNLEVEDFHSYFVGCVPVLVHNKCHGHHSDPKYLGGDPKQPLTYIDSTDHNKIHSLIDEVFPRRKGTAYYNHLRQANSDFDNKVYSTLIDIYQKYNDFVNNFNRR